MNALTPGKVEKLPSTLPPFLQSYYRMGVIGDGSCFFHSLCCSLNYQQYNSKTDIEKRAMVAKFRCGFSKIYPENTQEFCTVKKWADRNLIEKTAKYLQMNIMFINTKTKSVYCGVHGEETIDGILGYGDFSQPTVVVMWVSNNQHFEPLVKVEDGKPCGFFVPSNKEDKKFITDLVHWYTTECSI